MRLAEVIKNTHIESGQLGIFYLAQSGFLIKTANQKTIIIDAYLSDAAERLFGFKRMIPTVIDADEVDVDLYLSSHEHIDHLDLDALPVIMKNKKTHFIGAPDCEKHYRALGLKDNEFDILSEGQKWTDRSLTIRAIYADHGDLAPDALGYLLEIDGVKIYHSGDTALRPKEIKASLHTDVDIMIVPINGQYGNMNAFEACSLAQVILPSYIIPSHFWMFIEHVAVDGTGDPFTFLQEAEKLPNEVKTKLMAPGELWKFKKQTDKIQQI